MAAWTLFATHAHLAVLGIEWSPSRFRWGTGRVKNGRTVGWSVKSSSSFSSSGSVSAAGAAAPAVIAATATSDVGEIKAAKMADRLAASSFVHARQMKKKRPKAVFHRLEHNL